MSAQLDATRPSLSRYLQSPWLRPFNDPAAIDELIQRVLPRAAIANIHARVEQVIDETADTRSFVLRANRHWRGFRAGQHVLVTMEVRGRRLQRCFSLSSAPTRDRRVTITVKRQSDQGVTAWMHAHLGVGAIVTISPAMGRFCIPDAVPRSVLMLSCGSGVTPMMAILRDLFVRGYSGDIVLLHSCKDAADTIFGGELQAMATAWPALRVVMHFSATHGRLDEKTLAQYVPDFGGRFSLMCGPAPFALWVRALYRQHAAEASLHSEQFGLPRPELGDGPVASSAVLCEKSEQSFTAESGQPLLLAAEAAGLSPRHGCRIGICRSCQCRKRSGMVENLLTGEISAEPEQLIQLCISAARSPLTLDL